MREDVFISVVMPTYKRLDFLRHAVDSVIGQTYSNWELIVTDDEEGLDTETWHYLKEIAGRHNRVRIIKNSGEHGQVANTNNGLWAAKGEWIKLLHDDDRLKPECLKYFAAAARKVPEAAIIACRTEVWMGDVKKKSINYDAFPLFEVVEQKYIHLGMYLQEDIGCGIPSAVMVNRKYINENTVFAKYPGLESGIDSFWNMRVCQNGDSVIINRHLAEWHQGHETVTSNRELSALDQEYVILRNLQLPLISKDFDPPSITVVTHMLRAIRAIQSFKSGAALRGLGLAIQAYHPMGWFLASKWLLRKYYPRKFTSIPYKQV